MSNEQLVGKYERLRAELAEAYVQPEWNQRRIDRIANELADLETLLAAHAPHRDRTTAHE